MDHRRHFGLASRLHGVEPVTDRSIAVSIWMIVLAALILVSILAAYARPAAAQEVSYPCPAGAKSCKIVVMVPDEENTLIGADMIFDHAVWANRVKFDSLVAAWREKLRQAPQGKVVPKPEEDLKK